MDLFRASTILCRPARAARVKAGGERGQEVAAVSRLIQFAGIVRVLKTGPEKLTSLLVCTDKPAGDAVGAVTFDSAWIDKAGSKRINDVKIHWIRPLPKSRFGFLSRYRVLHRPLAHGWRQAANNPRADCIVPAWGVSSTSR